MAHGLATDSRRARVRAAAATRLVAAGLVLALAACGTDATSPGASPSPTGPVPPATAPVAPSIAPSVGPGSLAGLTWTRLVGPPAWEYVAFERVTAGGGGYIAIGELRGEERRAVQAWWSPAGASWRDMSPDVAGPSWGQLPIAFPAGFAILGGIEDAAAGGDTNVAWITTQGGVWSILPALDDWVPHWAATPAARALVVGLTMPVGGAPSSSWISGDFASWQEVPIPADGWVYVNGIVTLDDGRVLAFGRVTPEAVDVVPVPQGSVALWTNRDGLAWNPVDTGDAFLGADVELMAARPGRIVAVGRMYDERADPDAPAPVAYWWSDDGVTWTRAEGPDVASAYEPQLVAVDDRFVLLGASDGITRVLASSDAGLAWQVPDEPAVLDGEMRDVVRYGDLVLGVGSATQGGEQAAGAMWFTVASDE